MSERWQTVAEKRVESLHLNDRTGNTPGSTHMLRVTTNCDQTTASNVYTTASSILYNYIINTNGRRPVNSNHSKTKNIKIYITCTIIRTDRRNNIFVHANVLVPESSINERKMFTRYNNIMITNRCARYIIS